MNLTPLSDLFEVWVWFSWSRSPLWNLLQQCIRNHQVCKGILLWQQILSFCWHARLLTGFASAFKLSMVSFSECQSILGKNNNFSYFQIYEGWCGFSKSPKLFRARKPSRYPTPKTNHGLNSCFDKRYWRTIKSTYNIKAKDKELWIYTHSKAKFNANSWAFMLVDTLIWWKI